MFTTSRARAQPVADPRGTREAILDATRTLYLLHGTSGVSIRRIADRAGVSPTAIYVHFRSLDDVLERLRLEGQARLARALRRAAAGARGDAVERLRAMGRAYWRFGRRHRAYYALMFGVREAAQSRPAALAREIATLDVVRAAVERGMAAGELRPGDPVIVAGALWAQVHGVTALAVSGLLRHGAAGRDAAVLETVLDSAAASLRP